MCMELGEGVRGQVGGAMRGVCRCVGREHGLQRQRMRKSESGVQCRVVAVGFECCTVD